MERIGERDEEEEKRKKSSEMEEHKKKEALRKQRMKRIEEVLDEVEVLVGIHFFAAFEQSSSLFLKRLVSNQKSINMNLLRKAWRMLNCTPKTMNITREVQENVECVGTSLLM